MKTRITRLSLFLFVILAFAYATGAKSARGGHAHGPLAKIQPVVTQKCLVYSGDLCSAYGADMTLPGVACHVECYHERVYKGGTRLCTAMSSCQYDRKNGCLIKNKCARLDDSSGLCASWEQEAHCPNNVVYILR